MGTYQVGDFLAVVITGNGSHETKRVRALAEDFDHVNRLYFPYDNTSTGIRLVGTRRTQPNQATVKNLEALNVIKHHKSRGFREFLFVMDKEHIDGDSFSELSSKLEDLSSNGTELRRINEDAFECEFECGGADVLLRAAIVGGSWDCFEDGLSELIRITGGPDISATSRDDLKNQVQRELADRSGANLIEESSREELYIAFPNICSILEPYDVT